MTRATKLFLVYTATIIVTAVSGFLFFGSAVVGGMTAMSSQSESEHIPEEEEVVEEDTTTATETEETSESVSAEAEEALVEAQYVVDMGATSRVSLMDYLGTDYGMGFSDEAVTYAVDNVDIDWGDNATGTAEIFLEGNPEATADEVFNFLVDPELNGFTDGEAEQAIGQLGLLN